MKHILTLILILIAESLSAQIQHPTLISMLGIGGEAGDYLYSRPIKTYDGGFIIPIQTRSSTGNLNTGCTSTDFRYLFNKYNSDGTILEWQKCIPYNNDSGFRYMFSNSNDTFTIGGALYSSSTAQDFLLQKRDNVGSIVWTKVYGGVASELLRDMTQTPDGGYVMLGISNSNDGDVGFHYGGQLNMDIWVLKLDSNGTKEWSTVLGGTSEEEAYSVLPRAAGGYYVLGGSGSDDFDCSDNHGQWDVFLARLDDTGGKVWTKCLGGSGEDASQEGWCVENTKGELLIATHTSSSDGDIKNHIGNADYWLVSVDSMSNLVWERCFGSSSGEIATSLCVSTDNTIWIGGSTFKAGGQVDNEYGGGDAWLVHTDSTGNFLSSRVLGTPERDEVAVLHPLPGGLIFVGGTYDDSGTIAGLLPTDWHGLTDVFLARFAPWTTSIDNIETPLEISVFPNPASDIIHISAKGKKVSIQVIDITGREVYNREQISGSTTIDVQNWSKGQYYLQARDKNGRRSVTKFLII